MYVAVIPNRNSPPAILLCESYREGGKVKKKTIANLSKWPPELVESFKRLLQGAVAVNPKDLFTIESSAAHGHVEAVLGTIKNIGLDYIISSKPCRERSLVLAMIAGQIIHPSSRLGSVRLWPATTLAEELQITDADEDDLYSAMDWLLQGKNRIEKKLAGKHLSEGSHALYDISSSYYEGITCPLAQYGYNRDGKKGKKIIVYGMLTNAEGCPIAVQVYPGKTKDSITVPDQADKLRRSFGLEKVVLVGDRGMITQTQVDHLKQYPGIGWITAMGYQAIKQLSDEGSLQLSLFDKSNIAEITSKAYPGERFIACHNPLVGEKRHKKRQALLEATEKDLDKIVREAARRTKKKLSSEEISIKVGKVIGKHKMEKHFELSITEGTFSYHRRAASIEQESGLDGIYVIRTNEPKEQLSTEDTVRSYKNLSKVERLFRTLKGMEILVRPIRHRLEERVNAHIFICMLAYYVEWHMRKALAPLLFDDEQLDEDRKVRDAVKPAVPSESAKKKKSVRKTEDGIVVQSFNTLLTNLSSRTRNRCRFNAVKTNEKSIINQLTELTPLQKKTFDLLKIRT
jgi:transposase